MSVYLLVKVTDEWASHTERRVRDELIGIEEVVKFTGHDPQPCCLTCEAVKHNVYAVAPSTVPDPQAMEPGDAQRALAEIWDAYLRRDK